MKRVRLSRVREGKAYSERVEKKFARCRERKKEEEWTKKSEAEEEENSAWRSRQTPPVALSTDEDGWWFFRSEKESARNVGPKKTKTKAYSRRPNAENKPLLPVPFSSLPRDTLSN